MNTYEFAMHSADQSGSSGKRKPGRIPQTKRRYEHIPAGTATCITEYNEQLVRRLIEKVTVYQDRFAAEFCLS